MDIEELKEKCTLRSIYLSVLTENGDGFNKISSIANSGKPTIIVFNNHASLILEGQYIFDPTSQVGWYSWWCNLKPIQFRPLQGLNERTCASFVLFFYDIYKEIGLIPAVNLFNSRHGYANKRHVLDSFLLGLFQCPRSGSDQRVVMSFFALQLLFFSSQG